MRFTWAKSNYNKAEIVILGVPDESGSHSSRKGVSLAPDRIRKVSSERDVFERGGEKSLATAYAGMNKRVFDIGNIRKNQVRQKIQGIAKDGKIPVVMGGDHSITAEILEGLDAAGKRFSVVYFDSHPDFICSTKKYFGSVICDIRNYRNVDFKKSVEIGIRSPEPEELKNLRRHFLKTYSPFDIEEKGLERILREIKRRMGKRVYISIDMDVVDPAFAPGVSTPVPFGLTDRELIYLLRNIAKLGLIGMDIMEVNPRCDIQDMTSHLAARTIIETISYLR